MRPWPLLSLLLAAGGGDVFIQPQVLLESAFCRAARCVPQPEATRGQGGTTVRVYRLEAFGGFLRVSGGGAEGWSLSAA